MEPSSEVSSCSPSAGVAGVGSGCRKSGLQDGGAGVLGGLKWWQDGGGERVGREAGGVGGGESRD